MMLRNQKDTNLIIDKILEKEKEINFLIMKDRTNEDVIASLSESIAIQVIETKETIITIY